MYQDGQVLFVRFERISQAGILRILRRIRRQNHRLLPHIKTEICVAKSVVQLDNQYHTTNM